MGLREDRVHAAMLDGVASRWACKPPPLHIDVLAECVRELHAITTDPAVITLAAAGFVGSERWWSEQALRLLEVAGADLDEAARIKASRGPGWNPPQASPERDRTG